MQPSDQVHPGKPQAYLNLDSEDNECVDSHQRRETCCVRVDFDALDHAHQLVDGKPGRFGVLDTAQCVEVADHHVGDETGIQIRCEPLHHLFGGTDEVDLVDRLPGTLLQASSTYSLSYRRPYP